MEMVGTAVTVMFKGGMPLVLLTLAPLKRLLAQVEIGERHRQSLLGRSHVVERLSSIIKVEELTATTMFTRSPNNRVDCLLSLSLEEALRLIFSRPFSTPRHLVPWQ